MYYSYIKKEIGHNKSYLFLRIFKILLVGRSSKKVLLFFRMAALLKRKNYNFLSAYINRKVEKNYGVYINREADIKPGLSFPHPIGIVIGQGVRIDEDVVIYQHVTLGGARRGDWQENNYPSIGAGTVIFSGAVIVGNIKVGKNCVIGANAVVINDIPDNSTAVGVPAKIIKEV